MTISLRSWVRNVAFSKRKLKQLYEQLEYLNMKMNGCCSPTYGREFNVPSDPYKNQMLYWMERLDKCEQSIKNHEAVVGKYNAFKESLNEMEQLILDKYFYQGLPPRMIIEELEISRNVFYIITGIVENKFLTPQGTDTFVAT